MYLRRIRGPAFVAADRVAVPIHTDPGEQHDSSTGTLPSRWAVWVIWSLKSSPPVQPTTMLTRKGNPVIAPTDSTVEPWQ